MDKIILIGGGGHCKSVIDVIEREGRFHIAGIIDQKNNIGKNVLGYKIVASDSDLDLFSKKYVYALITIGQIKNPDKRVELFNLAKKIGFKIPVVVSPRAYVSKYAVVNEGTIIMHDALVNSGAKVGRNCIVNSKALIEHDANIGDNCHISTGAIVNGGANVSKGSFLGSNASTKEYVRVDGVLKSVCFHKGVE